MIEWPFRLCGLLSLKKCYLHNPSGVQPQRRFEEHVLSSNIKMDEVEVIIVID